MTPFLKQVAQTYFENERDEMIDYCFVFPNKRSGVFFRHFLTEAADGDKFIFPEIITIGEMTAGFSALTEATRLDQLFILYNEYSALSRDISDFDQFLFWGDMLLSDFNDVDRYLVDPHLLFVNLKRFREVSANYLTEEQKEIINRYWGEQYPHQSPDRFWNHLHHEQSTELETKFLKLWEVLDQLFINFKKRLMDVGMATSGMLSRNAVDYLKHASSDTLPYRRYIFVGFNVLTLSEIKIFERLQARDRADFYWDMAAPTFKAEGNKAALFMKHNIECFHSRYDIASANPIPDNHFPHIHITGIPSSVGQAKAAGKQLEQWMADGIIAHPDNAINTAIVLPDESLFIPMIHAVPPELTALNVTMGYPMKNTSFASFISAIVSMQLRSRLSKEKWHFFHDDVKTVVTHPFTRSLCNNECNAILRAITERHLYMIPAETFTELAPTLAFMFTPVSDTNGVEEVYSYFTSLIDSLTALTAKHEGMRIEKFFLNAYRSALEELKNACDRWGIAMKNSTFIELLQRTIASVSINFTGEPLKGLQVMGVLETRVLDFDNLIMLSMNERIFPRKHYTRSFIPDSLRRSYGMATTDFQESIYAYYFYRLISRADNVRLYYDARTVGTKNSEMSRYISQLLYLFPQCNITHDIASFPMPSFKDEKIEIHKTPEIMEKLMDFTRLNGRTLSASSIKEYIKCPLEFYLNRVCNLRQEDEVIEYMDSSTYGTILHAVAETIYKELRGEHNEVKITADILDSIINHPVKIDRVITQLINEKYNKLPAGDLTPLVGETKILGQVMKHFMVVMFREEKKIAPFDFIEGEQELRGRLRINDNLSINFCQYIDRLDRVYPEGRYGTDGTGTLRIVDYKTGDDKENFTSFDQLFSHTSKDHRSAIFQLLFYCNAYSQHESYDGPIQPILYQFKSMSTKGITPVSFGNYSSKKIITDYRLINDEFMAQFSNLIMEMFDPDIPFTQSPNDADCKFCTFKTICRRYPK